MTIQEGDRLPEATLHVMGDAGPSAVSTADLFSEKRVVVFAVPGAFTPTCSQAHLPGFVAHAGQMKETGVDSVVCIAVNDAFVMDAWGKSAGADELTMVADGNGDFTKAIGLEMDGSGFGLGTRSQRYAMIVDDGIVAKLAVEAPGAFEVSRAEAILKLL